MGLLARCLDALDRHGVSEALVQFCDTATWLLRLHRRGCLGLWEPCLSVTKMVRLLARRLIVWGGSWSPEQLVLAAEATGLAAAGVLAFPESAEPGASELSLTGALLADANKELALLYKALLHLMDRSVLTTGRAAAVLPDLVSVPGAAESLAGAAEASLRLTAAMVQHTQTAERMAVAGNWARTYGTAARLFTSAATQMHEALESLGDEELGAAAEKAGLSGHGRVRSMAKFLVDLGESSQRLAAVMQELQPAEGADGGADWARTFGAAVDVAEHLLGYANAQASLVCILISRHQLL